MYLPRYPGVSPFTSMRSSQRLQPCVWTSDMRGRQCSRHNWYLAPWYWAIFALVRGLEKRWLSVLFKSTIQPVLRNSVMESWFGVDFQHNYLLSYIVFYRMRNFICVKLCSVYTTLLFFKSFQATDSIIAFMIECQVFKDKCMQNTFDFMWWIYGHTNVYKQHLRNFHNKAIYQRVHQ